MTFRVKFSEQGGSFRARFGETHNLSDGGYERGYEAGYAVGYTEGGEAAIAALPVYNGEVENA